MNRPHKYIAENKANTESCPAAKRSHLFSLPLSLLLMTTPSSSSSLALTVERSFHGVEYVCIMEVVPSSSSSSSLLDESAATAAGGEMLVLEVEQKRTGERWRGEFSPQS